MATTDSEQAAVTIPAAYLEDVRQGLVDEINSVSDALSIEQAKDSREDRDSSVKILGRAFQVLEQLVGATGDTRVTASAGDMLSDPLLDALQATVRVLGRRLVDVCDYGPLPMGDVVELSLRLRWAADEAIRLCPNLGRRLADEKAVA